MSEEQLVGPEPLRLLFDIREYAIFPDSVPLPPSNDPDAFRAWFAQLDDIVSALYRPEGEYPCPGIPITSSGTPPDKDAVDTLLDLAKQDRKQDFVDLARMVGVAEADCEPFWRGTRKRLAKEGRV